MTVVLRTSRGLLEHNRKAALCERLYSATVHSRLPASELRQFDSF